MKNLVLILVLSVVAFALSGARTGAATTCMGSKKPLVVVLVYDEGCKIACTVVRPVVRGLAEHQSEFVDYIELNTSQEALQASMQQATALHIKTFVSDRTDQVPVVGFFGNTGQKCKLLKELAGHKKPDVYKLALNKCLEKVGK